MVDMMMAHSAIGSIMANTLLWDTEASFSALAFVLACVVVV